MPRTFDNIEQDLLPAFRQTLEVADHAGFCVGYFSMLPGTETKRQAKRKQGKH